MTRNSSSKEPKNPKLRSVYVEFTSRSDRPSSPEAKAAGDMGRVIIEAITHDLFLGPRQKDLSLARKLLRPSDFRHEGIKVVTHLRVAHEGVAPAPSSALMWLPLTAAGVEDPWVFANRAAEDISWALHDTPYLLPHRNDSLRDALVSGGQPMTYCSLVGHIAHQAEQITLPTEGEDLAKVITGLGTAMAWAVTGGAVPSVSFTYGIEPTAQLV
ncbi:MAG TPA: hypothetical protein VLI54_06245 [Bacillota bacterium]|nr:hypothetical protein [Bacillota bacterium]